MKLLARHGLRAERFSKPEMRQRKTPDFRVYKGTEFVLYGESKHVQYDNWLDEQFENARPLEIIGGLRHDPIFNRLAGHIHDATKQFHAVNADHEFPNVLILTNSDTHCGFTDLVNVLTRNSYAEGGGVEPIYKEISEGRIREEKLTIDLYVWLNEWKGEQQKGFSISTPAPNTTVRCLNYSALIPRSIVAWAKRADWQPERIAGGGKGAHDRCHRRGHHRLSA